MLRAALALAAMLLLATCSCCLRLPLAAWFLLVLPLCLLLGAACYLRCLAWCCLVLVLGCHS